MATEEKPSISCRTSAEFEDVELAAWQLEAKRSSRRGVKIILSACLVTLALFLFYVKTPCMLASCQRSEITDDHSPRAELRTSCEAPRLRQRTIEECQDLALAFEEKRQRGRRVYDACLRSSCEGN
jgi:hypothetical protein